jgi:hypothetical protein
MGGTTMTKAFVCSLCRNGILGGALYLDPQALTYRTNKLTVDPKYRSLVLPLKDIESLSWKQIVFPVASFRMTDGETYTMIIFNKPRFLKYYEEYKGT